MSESEKPTVPAEVLMDAASVIAYVRESDGASIVAVAETAATVATAATILMT